MDGWLPGWKYNEQRNRAGAFQFSSVRRIGRVFHPGMARVSSVRFLGDGEYICDTLKHHPLPEASFLWYSLWSKCGTYKRGNGDYQDEEPLYKGGKEGYLEKAAISVKSI